MLAWLTRCLDYYQANLLNNDFFFVGFNLQQLPDAMRLINNRGTRYLSAAVTVGKRPSYWVNHPDEPGHPYGHSFFICTQPILSDRVVVIK